MVIRKPDRTLWRNSIAPVDVLRLAARWVRPGICSGGCETTGFNFGSSSGPTASEPGVAPEMPATIRADEVVGRWGLASYQNPNDRARTEKMARDQCKQPYVI